jgi:regulator of sigma E protease
MIDILAIIFVFGVLVIIHELGHFIAAKLMGVRVEKFSIGFPPKLWSKKIGETEFTLSAIPLGGYVKMSGFVDESMDDASTGADYEFNSKPVWKRMIIIVAGVVMNLLLAIVVLTILNFTEGEKIIPSTQIGVVGEEGIAQKVGFKAGDKILEIAGKKVKSWNDVSKTFFDHLNEEIVFKVERNGTLLNLLYKKEWFSEEKGELLNIRPLLGNRIGDISASMPASELGLKRGDAITSINGEAVHYWGDLTRIVRQFPEHEITISWNRNGQSFEGKITPKKLEEQMPNEQIEEVGKIGVGPYYEFNPIPLGDALMSGFSGTFQFIALNAKGIWWVISGAKSAKDVMGGPIYIAQIAGDAANAGWTYLWRLIAALSSVLAFFNILPIPALDGGHLFFLIIEGVMRKPLSMKTRMKIQQVGMAILLALIILIVYIDLRRIFF